MDRAVSEVKEITNLNNENEMMTAMFYTRQLYLNVMISVYRNLEPSHWDVVYLRHSTPAPQEELEEALKNIHQQGQISTSMIQNQPVEDLLLVTKNVGLENQERNEYCLVTLDVRNLWTVPFDLHFEIDNTTEEGGGKLESRITILPGTTSRYDF